MFVKLHVFKALKRQTKLKFTYLYSPEKLIFALKKYYNICNFIIIVIVQKRCNTISFYVNKFLYFSIVSFD